MRSVPLYLLVAVGLVVNLGVCGLRDIGGFTLGHDGGWIRFELVDY